jgi:hypothetical protein
MNEMRVSSAGGMMMMMMMTGQGQSIRTEKPVSVLICSTQIPHGLIWD